VCGENLAQRFCQHVLHISASPRGQRSEPLAIAATFLDEVRATRPDVTIEHWDLWDGSLPEFGPAAAAATMATFGGADPVGDEATAWRAARDTFDRFDSVDHYLFPSRCGTRWCPTSSSGGGPRRSAPYAGAGRRALQRFVGSGNVPRRRGWLVCELRGIVSHPQWAWSSKPK
jgi:hypothetical protein